MVARRSQGNWRWEGPLGTPLGLVHWKRASSPVEAGGRVRNKSMKLKRCLQVWDQRKSMFNRPKACAVRRDVRG